MFSYELLVAEMPESVELTGSEVWALLVDKHQVDKGTVSTMLGAAYAKREVERREEPAGSSRYVWWRGTRPPKRRTLTISVDGRAYDADNPHTPKWQRLADVFAVGEEFTTLEAARRLETQRSMTGYYLNEAFAAGIVDRRHDTPGDLIALGVSRRSSWFYVWWRIR